MAQGGCGWRRRGGAMPLNLSACVEGREGLREGVGAHCGALEDDVVRFALPSKHLEGAVVGVLCGIQGAESTKWASAKRMGLKRRQLPVGVFAGSTGH